MSKYNHIFEPYRNCHEGRSATLFATGPTLKLYKPPENDIIHIGINKIMLIMPNLKLDYYFVADYNPKLRSSIKELKAKKFCGSIVDGKSFNPAHFSPGEGVELGAKICELTRSLAPQKDISKYPLFSHSIVFCALHFILFTGVKKVYLVGCDGGYEKKNLPLLCMWDQFKGNVINKFYRDVEMITINPKHMKHFKPHAP